MISSTSVIHVSSEWLPLCVVRKLATALGFTASATLAAAFPSGPELCKIVR